MVCHGVVWKAAYLNHYWPYPFGCIRMCCWKCLNFLGVCDFSICSCWQFGWVVWEITCKALAKHWMWWWLASHIGPLQHLGAVLLILSKKNFPWKIQAKWKNNCLFPLGSEPRISEPFTGERFMLQCCWILEVLFHDFACHDWSLTVQERVQIHLQTFAPVLGKSISTGIYCCVP